MRAVLIGVGLMMVAGSALAHDDDWKHYKRHHRHFVPPGHTYYVERPVIVERPVVYAPRVYYPEPMYYGPPPAPSLNINIPLR